MKRSTVVNWLLGLGFVALAVIPLVFVDGEYAGADGQAVEIVEDSHPGYEPWFAPIYEPPSEEVASGLFALQAALGAGALGYFVGRAHGRHRAHTDTAAVHDAVGEAGTGQADAPVADAAPAAGTSPEAAR